MANWTIAKITAHKSNLSAGRFGYEIVMQDHDDPGATTTVHVEGGATPADDQCLILTTLDEDFAPNDFNLGVTCP